MPALPQDIAAATRDVVTGTFVNALIAERYPSARDGTADPATGYFDAVADATTIANARGALIGTERRRFTAVVSALVWPKVASGLPQVHLIDAAHNADATFLAARIELDLETETTTYELFG